jgi:protein TonB
MLESSLFESQGRKKTRKPMTVVVSAIAHVVTVGVLVLIPLLQTQALTIPPVDIALFLPRVEQPRDVLVVSGPPAQRQSQSSTPDVLTAPTALPRQIVYTVDPPVISDLPFSPGRNTGITGAGNPFTGDSIPVTAPPVAPPPPQPPPAPIINARPFRQSSGVQAARLIYQVKPVYPQIARQTRTQGVVVLEAVISKDGSVDSLRVVSGHLLLTQAAVDAVRQWKYQPTMLSGEPVDVITTVTVTFTLQ